MVIFKAVVKALLTGVERISMRSSTVVFRSKDAVSVEFSDLRFRASCRPQGRGGDKEPLLL